MSGVVLLTLIQARIKQNLDDLKERRENLEHLQEVNDAKNGKKMTKSFKKQMEVFETMDYKFLQSSRKYKTMIIWMHQFNKPS